MKKERLYLLSLLAVLISVLLALGLFNALIDPHRFFHLVSIKGFNEYKTYVTKMRLRKPVHIYQRKPSILLMGSSRAGGGLHCRDYTDNVDDCYNTALRGITTYEQCRLLEHAITVADAADKKIQQVILKVSYATFMAADLTKEGFEEDLATRENTGISFAFRKALLEKYFYALFSWEGFTDSRMTIKYQDRPYAWRATGVWNFEEDGSWKTYDLPQYQNDPALIHTNRTKQWLTSANAMKTQFAYMKKQMDANIDLETNYSNFAKLLELAYRHQVPVKMLFPAEHADYLLMMDAAGMWPYAETWKRRLVLMNEQIAAQYHSEPYPIWDFGGINEYSTETSWDKLPVGQSMLWYEDIVHFRGELGAKMLAVMRDDQTQGSWFETVDSHNIDTHLDKLRQDKEAYKIKMAKSH